MHSPPRTDELKSSYSLRLRILKRIEDAGGWIDFHEYMQMALYDPEFGYYASGQIRFGESGDFITAPMIGPHFAQCIARQCAEILNSIEQQVSARQVRCILEFGAGTGHMATDILQYFESNQWSLDRYLIIEPNAGLAARQKQRIVSKCPQLIGRVKWLKEIPRGGFCGVVLANEVLDAMPVSRFQMDERGVAKKMGVVNFKGELKDKISDMPVDSILQERLSCHELDFGYQGDAGLYAEAWVKTVGESIDNGVILLIDYGFPRREFYHWDRNKGTLMCHYKHQSHADPYLYPGLQDITAHIDFTSMAEAGIAVGMEVSGFASQGAFLLSLGLLEQLDSDTVTVDSLNASQEIKKLTLPHEMGELFKVLALTKNYNQPMSGFNMQNHRDRL